MAFGDNQTAAVDLTLVFDPAEVWPDPMSCPDWPSRVMQTRTGQQIAGERHAVEQLELLVRTLARSEVVREPTEAERKTAFDAHFRRLDDPDVGGWRGIIHGIAPLNHVVETRANQIVEGLHIRGYLRKLEAQRARSRDVAADQECARHQGKIDRYTRQAEEMQDELSNLSEAAARHQQRLDDEKAWRRAQELQERLRGGYGEATEAARALGVQPPRPPQF